MRIVGIGTEIVECLRIAQMIERHGEVFLRRVYTAGEIEYCSSRKSTTQHYAARWAGKQAVLKALGLTYSGGSDWRDIEIRPTNSGLTKVGLAGDAKAACLTRGIEQIIVSVARCRSHATGYALTLSRE